MCQKGPWVGEVTVRGEEGAPQLQPPPLHPCQACSLGTARTAGPAAPHTPQCVPSGAEEQEAGWVPALGIFQA